MVPEKTNGICALIIINIIKANEKNTVGLLDALLIKN